MNNQKASKNEICRVIAENTNIRMKEIEIVFDEIFNEIKSKLKEGKSLTIKNFGKFKIYGYKNMNMNKSSIIKVKKSKKGWKNEKHKQILIRVYNKDEIELINRFQNLCKGKKDSFNKIIKEVLIEQLESLIYAKELSKNQNIIKEIMNHTLDETVIPRVSKIIKTTNEHNLIKIELVNRKINFLINEMGQARIIDGKPIINDINLKVKDKNWMLEEELKINEEIQIKKN
ncbi:HU family DNA-binding protein [Spiroplasma cantharicola]|uniref:DNA-binding protein HU-beta n=1 Tax=Spiroplasma cantharicola TaxID=362837 RepID=A0A0M4KEF9_9MOLU|nr:HU family DNA-binding protein [Spiroplasma cantharicola]ALD66370.1 hypothetical protein SCANT_v1c04640 [Spiroplasma cantharicola]